MTDINQLMDEVHDWAEATFPDRTDASILLKMYSELGEVMENPTDALEHADVFILLLDYAKRNNVNIGAAIREKLEINKQRKWEMDVGIGVMRHVK